MIVMKFGGTSLLDAGRVRAAASLIEHEHARGPVAVVVSAHGGVTDVLLGLARSARAGDTSALAPLEERHRSLARGLGLGTEVVDGLLAELRRRVEGIASLGVLEAQILDLVASYGERLSASVVAACLRSRGLSASAVASWDLGLVTDSRFGEAGVLQESYGAMARELPRVSGVPVVTGFVARDARGQVTTLGRGGSDYTASILGAAAGAREVQIWTDVPGVMTADPRYVSRARSIETLSFAEASELAYYGAKVIHPSTLLPAVERDIPVRVLCTLQPAHPGTLILPRSDVRHGVVKSIAHRRGLFLISVVSTRMLQAVGFLARVFQVFAEHGVVIDLVSTSEVSVSVTTDDGRGLPESVAALRAFSTVEVADARGIVTVVGEGLRETAGVAGRVFGALAEEGVNVEAISQGATRVALSVVVRELDVERAVGALHRRFFEGQES
ncbi:MAG: aspartate kinase [Planctomycetes bacterium]|nr:aspartate kinase [Planctomycetota bacterium]